MEPDSKRRGIENVVLKDNRPWFYNGYPKQCPQEDAAGQASVVRHQALIAVGAIESRDLV